MHSLDPAARTSILDGLVEVPINTLFVQSVLRGHIDGTVYADHAHDPGALYALHPYGMALLWGTDRDARWLAWLTDHLLHGSHTAEWLQVYPNAWIADVEAVLDSRLSTGAALKQTRVNFRFDEAAYLDLRVDGVTVPVTAEMFDFEGSVVPKRFWRDAEQFIDNGGGFATLVDGEIAAMAFCSYRHGAQLEIGIETVERHRGNGYARRAACALIDDCLRRELQPVWACRRENVASFELARRLGFVPAAHLPYYRLPSA